jgi:hypothetical protein
MSSLVRYILLVAVVIAQASLVAMNVDAHVDRSNLNRINDLFAKYKNHFLATAAGNHLFGHHQYAKHQNEIFFETIISNAATTTTTNDTKYACLGYFDNLARVSSLFTQCVINNSRPFHLCQNCAQYYLQVKDTYSLIMSVSNSRRF